MTRKGFIGGLLASAGAAGCRTTSWFGETANLSFGVISDIHITTRESTERFRKALRYFRSRGADAVMVAGDLADWGLQSGLTYVKEAWDEEMAGTGIVPLLITGNHDYDGWWYGDMTLDMHLQGYSEDEALSRIGMKGCWEKTFGEPFDEIRLRKVNGYAFVSAEWSGTEDCENGAKTAAWLEAHRAELAGTKPFFFFRHSPIANTVSSSKPNEKDPLYKVLATFPNCIAFNGHTHRTYHDERSIWQGGFTAVSIPSMSYTSIPAGYENGRDRRNSETKLGMTCVASRENLLEAQGYLVRVTDGKVEIERHDFDCGEDTAAPWVVPVSSSERPYAFAEHAKRTPVPRFADGAVVKTDFVNSDTRNGCWTIFVSLDFPSAVACGGRVYDYEVRVIRDTGACVGMKRFLSPGFYRSGADEPRAQRFLFNGFDLPEEGRFRFEVVARNSFGAESKPIYSKSFNPKPGKDKTKYRSWN